MGRQNKKLNSPLDCENQQHKHKNKLWQNNRISTRFKSDILNSGAFPAVFVWQLEFSIKYKEQSLLLVHVCVVINRYKGRSLEWALLATQMDVHVRLEVLLTRIQDWLSTVLTRPRWPAADTLDMFILNSITPRRKKNFSQYKRQKTYMFTTGSFDTTTWELNLFTWYDEVPHSVTLPCS